MDWPAFDPNDVRIVSLGNEAFGAYVRAFRWCEEGKVKSLPTYEARLIAPDEIWSKLVSLGFVIVEKERFKLIPLVEKARKKKSIPLPDDFVLEDRHRDFAIRYGMTDAEIETNYDKFVAYHQSQATTSADWLASWRTWVINQATDFGRKPRPSQTSRVQQSLMDRVGGSAARTISLTDRPDLMPRPRR